MIATENSGNFVLPILNCIRCGHYWPPKTQNLPRVCPKCKSPYWNIPRKQRKTKV